MPLLGWWSIKTGIGLHRGKRMSSAVKVVGESPNRSIGAVIRSDAVSAAGREIVVEFLTLDDLKKRNG